MTNQFITYYTNLITVWNGSGAPPSGYTGNTFSGAGDTAANKLTAINSWVANTVTYSMIQGQKVLNSCASADLQALTSLQLQQLSAITGATGGVDPTPGSNQASALAAIFSGKANTLASLGSLQTSSKITTPWWRAQSLIQPVTQWDAVLAGLIANPNGINFPATYVYKQTNKRKINLNIAIDIQYFESSDGVTLGTNIFTDNGFELPLLANNDVMLLALGRIVQYLLPRDAAFAALTSN